MGVSGSCALYGTGSKQSSAHDWVQARAQHRQLAFEGYCHLPEMVHKEWYWTQGSNQRGPHSVAELFDMAYGAFIPATNLFCCRFIDYLTVMS